MPQSKVSELSEIEDLKLPIEINSVSVDESGRITIQKESVKSFNASFFYDDLPFNFTIKKDGTETLLTLTADFGFMPFSIESKELRKKFQGLLQIGKEFPKGVLKRSGDKIVFEMQQEIQPPLTPTQILSHLTAMVISAKPSLKIVKDSLSSL